MFKDHPFRLLLSESACRKLELKLDHPFEFVLSSIFHQIKSYLKIVGYESLFFVFDQCEVISLQDGLITYFPHNESVWDMSG
jgi:hypothetical protein